MPRNGRGGRVSASPGTPLANRTDLLTPQPVTTAPGQEYGEAGAQRGAQQALPMAGGAGGPGSLARQAPAPQPLPAPGTLPFLEQTQRPDEPVTAGLPTGPGPGPEAMPSPAGNIARQLRTIVANGDASPALARMAAMAEGLNL